MRITKDTASLLHFFRWWICELVNARLRPMFWRWRDAELAGDTARAERFHRLFFLLLNHTDCYPCRVIVDEFGLWVDAGLADAYCYEEDALC